MISEWTLQCARERILALGAAGMDSHSYRSGVLAELKTLVPHDAWVWPLADPITTVGIAPMAQGPFAEELPALISLRYRTQLNRWTTLPLNPSQAKSLQGVTGQEPGRSSLWPLLSRYAVQDILSIAFADRWGMWGWLELWRVKDGPEFTEAESHAVESMAAVVAVGLRECSAREFHQGGSSQALLRHPQAVLVLDDDLSIVSQTESSELWLSLLQRAPRPHQGVPAEVLNVAAQLLAVECGADHHRPLSRLHVGEGVWASLSAARMLARSATQAAPIAVTIQDCLPAERLAVFERCFALSPRECELLELAAGGPDTAALAGALGISKYTVQDTFKSIFTKCGVQSRGALLALALGTLASGGQ